MEAKPHNQNNLKTALVALLLLGLMTAGCGKIAAPGFDDSRDIASVGVDPEDVAQEEPGGRVDPPSTVPTTTPTPSPTPVTQTKTVTLKEAMNIRTLRNNVLDFVVELPAGSVLKFFDDTSAKNYDYRTSDGSVERSSTGFLHPMQIASVPASAQSSIPASRIKSINEAAGGVYVSASISGEIFRDAEKFPAIAGGTPGSGFLKSFEASGKPKFSWSAGIRRRFGDRVSRAIPMSSMSTADQIKWTKIYEELKKVGDRSVESQRDLMIIGSAQARQLSIRYENEGFVNDIGGWSVAVEGTAVRHGFANVPCAETMSELIRQAYKRAGYSHTEDFNSTKGNRLIWSTTAAVVELSRSLNVAGWVPWDAKDYRAPAGAIMMHTTGISPGHTYMAAGHDGRLIVDNGSPRGRDLRLTSASILEMMYMTGVFFLPPGIQPQAW